MKKIVILMTGFIIFAGLTAPMSVAAEDDEKTAPKETGGFDLGALQLQKKPSQKDVNKKNNDTQGTRFLKRAEEEKISVVTAFILEGIELLTKIVGSVAFLVLIIAGIWMIVSLGNEQQVTKGKTMFLYAILGLIFTFFSYLIVTFLQNLFIE